VARNPVIMIKSKWVGWLLTLLWGINISGKANAESSRRFAGSTLEELAEFFNVSVKEIEELTNFEKVSNRNLLLNQNRSQILTRPRSNNASKGFNYRVKRGDTLYGIARRHGISLSQLLQWNPHFRSNPNLIYPGEMVYLKG